MKIIFLTLQSSKEDWSERASELYQTKLKYFFDFELISLKAKSQSRENAELKKKTDTEQLIQFLKPQDYVILFDEQGKSYSSRSFAAQLQGVIDTSPQRIVFIIGGAYGVTDDLKQKSKLKVSLSTFVMNHHVAKIVALEQVYRAFTIQKNIPYHND